MKAYIFLISLILSLIFLVESKPTGHRLEKRSGVFGNFKKPSYLFRSIHGIRKLAPTNSYYDNEYGSEYEDEDTDLQPALDFRAVIQ